MSERVLGNPEYLTHLRRMGKISAQTKAGQILFYIIETRYSQLLRTHISLYLLVSSAENLCKQFGPRSGPTRRWAWSVFKLHGTLMVFLKEAFVKVNFENNQQTTKSMHNYPACLVDKSSSENSKSLFTFSVKKLVPSS